MTGTVTSNGSGQLQMSIPFLGWTEGGFSYYLTAATSATGPQSAPTAIVGLTTQFDFQAPSLSVSDIGGQLTFTVSGGGTTYDGVQEVGIIFMDVNGSESEGQVIDMLPVGGGTFVTSDAILHWADANAVPAFAAASFGGWGDPNGPQSTFIPGDTYQGQLANFVDFPAPPASAPAAPSGLRAQGYANSTGQGIRLIWNDQSDNETGFLVERSTSETGTYSSIGTAAADAQTYVDNSSDLQPGQTYWYEVIATAANSADDSALSAPASGVIPVVAPVAHMQVAKINDNNASGYLTPAQESTEGAYLPLDDNNWDYKLDSAGNNIPDMNQTGPDPEDQFLLPITLRELTGATAADGYTLSSSPGYNIWLHKDKTGLVTSSTFFSADQTTTVYVEGIKEGTFKLSASLDWKGTVSNADSVKLTVFGMSGPMDVAGGTPVNQHEVLSDTYQYYVHGAPGQWLQPVGGQSVPDPDFPAGGGPGNVDLITWNNDPVVGQAVFQPSPDYSWGWGVNVVRVDVPPQPSAYSFNINTFQVKGSTHIYAVNPAGTDAMHLGAWITLTGPNPDGGEGRGIRFIQVGFIQSAEDIRHYAVYEYGTSKHATLVPYLVDVKEGQPGPWVSSSTSAYSIWPYFGGGAKYFDSHPVTGPSDRVHITTSDTPNGPAAPSLDLYGTALPSHLIENLAETFWQVDLNDWVMATATDDPSIAPIHPVYVAYAQGSWDWDGSGLWVNGTFTPFKNAVSVNTVGAIGAVTIQPPNLFGTTANEAGKTISY